MRAREVESFCYQISDTRWLPVPRSRASVVLFSLAVWITWRIYSGYVQTNKTPNLLYHSTYLSFFGLPVHVSFMQSTAI